MLKNLNQGEIVKPAFKYIIEYWVVNFKLGRINIDFKLENRKKSQPLQYKDIV